MTALSASERLGGRVVGNTAAQFVAPGVRAFVGVALVAILGRYLGVAGFGEYGLVVAYVILLTNVLADWGLAAILVREVARDPGRRAPLIASATALQLVLAALAYGVLLTVAVLSSYSAAVRASLAVFGLTLLFAPVQMLTAHLAADLRLVRLVAPAVAGTLAQLVLVVVVVALEGPLVAVIAAGAVAVVVEQVWTAVLVLRELPLARPAMGPWKLFLAEAWPLGIATLLSTGARQAPALLLAAVSLEAVGVFAAAEKIPSYLTRIPYALRATLFPLLSRRWREPDRVAGLLKGTIAGTLALTAPIAIAGVVFAEGAAVLVFGPAFAGAAVPFAVLMVAFVFVGLGLLLEATLVAIGGQRVNLLIRSVAALMLLAMLLVLAPGGGATGSALAVLVSSAVAVVLTLIAVARGVRPRR